MRFACARRAPATSLLTLCLLVSQTAHAQLPADPTLREYSQQVRSRFSGDRAKDIVAFMESTWRVPGNEGFNASLRHVVAVLESAGYVPEETAGAGSILTYRMERRGMGQPTWEPVSGSVELLRPDGGPLLAFSSNRNMIAINSYSTPHGGIEAEVVNVGSGQPEEFDGLDVGGR
jgi:hypothetical protein